MENGSHRPTSLDGRWPEHAAPCHDHSLLGASGRAWACLRSRLTQVPLPPASTITTSEQIVIMVQLHPRAHNAVVAQTPRQNSPLPNPRPHNPFHSVSSSLRLCVYSPLESSSRLVGNSPPCRPSQSLRSPSPRAPRNHCAQTPPPRGRGPGGGFQASRTPPRHPINPTHSPLPGGKGQGEGF